MIEFSISHARGGVDQLGGALHLSVCLPLCVSVTQINKILEIEKIRRPAGHLFPNVENKIIEKIIVCQCLGVERIENKVVRAVHVIYLHFSANK